MTLKEAKLNHAFNAVDAKMEAMGYTNFKCIRRCVVNGHDTTFTIYFTKVNEKCCAVAFDCIDNKVLSEKEQICTEAQYKILTAC